MVYAPDKSRGDFALHICELIYPNVGKLYILKKVNM